MIVDPTYSTTLNFSVTGSAMRSADSYIASMPSGLNFLTSEVNLVFETDPDEMELLYQEFRNTKGFGTLIQPEILEGFYKDIQFFPEEYSVNRGSKDGYNTTINGLASMNSSIVDTGGSFINIKDDSGFNPRVKVISNDSEFASLNLEPYQVVYYEGANVTSHTFWDKIFFIGDDFLEYAKENSLDYATYINTKDLFLQYATQDMPLFLQDSTNLKIRPLTAKSELKDSFITKIKTGINEMTWDALSLTFDNLSDDEAFCLISYCEKSCGHKRVGLVLQPPFDVVSKYLLTSYSHTFVDCDVNRVSINITPQVQSFVSCV